MTMNPDLFRERQRASFAVERVTHLLDGGVDRTARRRQLQLLIERDPSGVFDTTNNAYLHRTERHVRGLAKHVRLVELCRQLKIGNNETAKGHIEASPEFATLVASIADDLPTALHWIMFVPNIISLCDDAQQQLWLPQCRDWRMIGCYAQTELGHGSNVRALETTATFVPEARGGDKGGSFIVHSPTLTSTKFWPGTLGRTANHAMVLARLIDGQGVDRGVHNFLVPLRHKDTHQLLPGVTTGDIGPKIGYNTMDNGYARFHHVRIPRRNMAMRFAQVDEAGNYRKLTVSPAASKIAYITMMQVRAHICNEAGKNLAMACTIAIRYSAVRTQGYRHSDDSQEERQILDYTQQQYRLFPLLAASYCFFFTGQRILQRLRDVEQQIVLAQSNSSNTHQNNTSQHSPVVVAVSKHVVADLHASTSGLKAYMTTVTADGIEDCRRACGGHGFLYCSGLPELYTTYLQNPTVEGDNHMLPQQVMKVLLKLVVAVQQQNDATTALADYESCDSYLLVPSLQAILHPGQSKTAATAPLPASSAPEDWMDLDRVLMPAFRHRAARALVDVAEQLQWRDDNKDDDDAWNGALVEMARANRAYAQCLLLHQFVQGIRQAQQPQTQQNGTNLGEAEARVLLNLARLLALYWMEQNLGDFLVDWSNTTTTAANTAKQIRRAVLQLLRIVRPDAVALVDARDFSDFRLKSALGRYDGNVYPAIVAAAERDPLNATDPGPGYEQHLKRLIVGGVGQYSGTISRL